MMKVVCNTALNVEAIRGMGRNELNMESIRKKCDKNESIHQSDYEKSKSSITVCNAI